jgi:DNA end-binding protein Ku
VCPGTTDSPRVSFTTLHAKCSSKLEQVPRCPKDGAIIEKDERETETVKGYELGKGVFLPVTEKDLEEAQPPADPEIRIEETLELAAIDARRWTGQVQYLEADVGSGPVKDPAAVAAYAKLVGGLRDASEGDGVVAVGRWATRGCDRLVGIYRLDGRLVAQGLRRPEEVRDIGELAAAEPARPEELAVVTPILERLKVDDLDDRAFPDERYEATVAILTKKAAERAAELARVAAEPRKGPKRAEPERRGPKRAARS